MHLSTSLSISVEMGNTGELQVWALLFAIKSCQLLCKYWKEVRLILDVQKHSRLCAGEAQRNVAQLCDIISAKAILTQLKIKPQIWWLEQLQSSIKFLSARFYTLEFSNILKGCGPLKYLQLLDRMRIIFSHFRNEFTSMCFEKEESEEYDSLWRNELFSFTR